MNVICIYWTGDFRGRDFTPEDVWRLYATVDKHMDRNYNFYTLTNDEKAELPGTTIPLLHADDWPGWWAKMELHRPDLPIGRTLYMDLDNHVIRSLTPILDTGGDLVMFDAPINKNEPGLISRYQAATMLFTTGKFTWMYEKFLKDWDYYLEHYRSDQDIMGEWIPNQPTWPDKYLVKMRDVGRRYRKEPPKEAIVVTGQPRNNLFRRTNEIPWLERMAR